MTTVKELKEFLDRMNDDDVVMFGYPANDYWKSTLARSPDLRKAKNLVSVEWSRYYEAYKVKDEDECGDQLHVILF